MTSRYADTFAAAAARGTHVTIPFFTIGDPTPDRFLEVVDAAMDAGADALELGIPFSDPTADGPAVQDGISRARAQGVDKTVSLDLVAEIRRRHPAVPIGLLVYGNLVFTPSPGDFYGRAHAAGVDSVLVADVPAHHIGPFREYAAAADVQTVLIAPPNARDEDLVQIARLSEGYVYLLSRMGVTGADSPAGAPVASVIKALREAGSAPTILGFGVSRPEHVRAAIDNGAAGVVSGSAFSNLVAAHLDDQDALTAQIRKLVAALVSA